MDAKVKKRLKIGAIVTTIVLALTALAGYGYYRHVVNKLDAGLERNTVDAIDTHPTNTEAPPRATKSETILIVGSDSRADGNGEGSEESNPGQRSDTMILLTVSKDRTVITGVSLPRDLMVSDPPECMVWDSETKAPSDTPYQFSNPVQINAGFSIGGPACAVKMAEKVSGLLVSRYIEIDFNGFKGIIDALGGIEITVDKAMIDNNLGVIFDAPGTYKVNGQKALDFARARQVQGDTASDLARIERQQYLIEEIIKQKLSPSILANPSKVNDLIEAFTNNVSTEHIDSDFLAGMALDVREVGLSNVNLHSLPVTEYAPDPNRLAIVPDKSAWLFGQMRDGKSVTDEDYANWTP